MTQRPIIFLAGPPGVGKTTLGRSSCQELGLSFLDLSVVGKGGEPARLREQQKQALENACTGRTHDVVALSWAQQQDPAILRQARKSGTLLLLWDHPLNMQARASRPISFRPGRPGKLKGGFGHRGTSCLEFRQLDRACEWRLMLIDASFDQARERLTSQIAAMREEFSWTPTEREGLGTWIEGWCHDMAADRKAAEVLADAMARHILDLRRQGAAPRRLASVFSDLQAGGLLVFGYDAPKAHDVLDCFNSAPWVDVFERKFSDSPTLVKRYRRNLRNFARFLAEERVSASPKGQGGV